MKLAVAALFGLVASVLAAPVIEVGSFLFRWRQAEGQTLTARYGDRNDRTTALPLHR